MLEGLLVAVLTTACAGLGAPSMTPATSVATPAAAATPSPRELFNQVQKLNQTTRAWRDRTQRMQVTITDRRGNERRREIELQTKKDGPKASRSTLFFLAPADVRGIAILQIIEPGQEDRNWLLLPDLGGGPRRVTGSERSGSFVGTDFSYEDVAIMGEILDWTDADAAVTSGSEAVVDGRACAVIEFKPTQSDISYGKVRLSIDRTDLVMRRLEMEDKSGKLAKTLSLSEIRQVGPIPAAYALDMRDEIRGSHTHVEFTDIRFNIGIADDEFTQRRLERGL
jgi:outer membrane lipoprotein-sorting protein